MASWKSVSTLAVALGSLVIPSTALAAHVGADDAADGQATVSAQPSAPDVSRVDVNYDPAGSVSLTVQFHAPLDVTDTSQNYAFYSNFTLGHAKAGFQSYSCDAASQGDISGQHHVFNAYAYTFYDQATVTGYDGLLKFTRTVAPDKKSVTIAATGPVIAGRDYNCATYVLRGRRHGPADNINTRYDDGCGCWYFSNDYDVVGKPRSAFDTSPPIYFDGYAPPPLPACNDGFDNDGDGKIDTIDAGCKDGSSTTENPACNDGIDNDGDGKADLDDDACGDSSSGNSEGPPRPVCSNGRDDDGDGRIDGKDPGCKGNSAGTSEVDPRPVKSAFGLKAKARKCRIETEVDVLPDLKPVQLFPFAKVRVSVSRGRYRIVRKLPLGESNGYVFKLLKPGRYTVSGSYPGDPFRLASKTAARHVVVRRKACAATRR